MFPIIEKNKAYITNDFKCLFFIRLMLVCVLCICIYIYICMFFYIKYNKIIINKNTKKFLKKFQIK
jgi:hypothetical protein